MSDDDERDERGLRARKKAAVYKHLTDAALKLFGDCGFERTTIDELAREGGVSPRTFFRYFASKEDVVLGWLLRLGDDLCACLAARPKSESPWAALRQACKGALAPHTADRARTLRLWRLFEETPSLRARHLEKQAAWEEKLSSELSRRMAVDARKAIEPRLYARLALGTLTVASDAWAARGGKGDLATFVDEAFARVHVRIDDA